MAENLSFVSQLKVALNIFDTPDPNRVLGIDVSHWTGVVDWQKAKEAGVKFAIIKFMNGITLTKYAIENYYGAKDAGILVGAYQWLYRSDNISAGRQARAYLQMLHDFPVDLPPVVDFEWTTWNGAPSNPNSNDLYGFVIPFEDNYGSKPVIYTAPGYWGEYGAKSPSWTEYPLWVAQYRVKAPSAILPWGNNYKIWQFTPNGDGVAFGQPSTSKSADLNYFNGSLAELYEFCQKTPPVVVDPPPPPVIEPPINLGKAATVVLPDGVNVRSGAGIAFPLAGPALPMDSHVQILGEQKDKFGNTWGNVVGGWVCMIYGGKSYVVYDGAGAGLYRVKHDNEYPLEQRPPRAKGWKPGKKLRGLPETRRLMGGRGSVQLSKFWDKFVESINTVNGYRYVRKDASGWCNHTWPKVECLTFGGNHVEVTRVVGNKAYVKTWLNNQMPPSGMASDTLIQKFSVVYNDGTYEMATPVGIVLTILIANAGDPPLWMDINDLVKIGD